MKKETILLKIGGSLITDKDSRSPKINERNLARIAREISIGFRPGKQRLIVVHGAGSFGHVIVKATGIHRGIRNRKQVIAFAETQRLQNELDVRVCGELIKNGVPAIPVEPTSSAVMDSGRLVSMDTKALEGMLVIGLVPVLYGVPAYDKRQGCSILSGDEIMTYLARKMRASRMVHATDVDGVFDGDPKRNPDAHLIREIRRSDFARIVRNICGSSARADVTGGMLNKVSEVFKTRKGLVGEIINGNRPGFVRRALSGEKGLGTLVRA